MVRFQRYWNFNIGPGVNCSNIFSVVNNQMWVNLHKYDAFVSFNAGARDVSCFLLSRFLYLSHNKLYRE